MPFEIIASEDGEEEGRKKPSAFSMSAERGEGRAAVLDDFWRQLLLLLALGRRSGAASRPERFDRSGTDLRASSALYWQKPELWQSLQRAGGTAGPAFESARVECW